MLVIFDVDGTLIGGEPADWASFSDSFLQAAGFSLTPAHWAGFSEITAQAIVHQALAEHPLEHRRSVEITVRQGYLTRLQAAHAEDSGTFHPANGAAALLKHLTSSPDFDLALATGDWFETISFKLSSSALEIAHIPIATSSDCYSRADIIALAAQRTGRPVTDAVYVGDGPWDFRATQQLGIPFIGVGNKEDRLREAGTQHFLPTLEPEPFLHTLSKIMT